MMHEPTISVAEFNPDRGFAYDRVLTIGCTCDCFDYVTDRVTMTLSELIALHGAKHRDHMDDCPHSRAHGEGGLWVCDVCGERFVRPEVRDLYGYPGNAREAADLPIDPR